MKYALSIFLLTICTQIFADILPLNALQNKEANEIVDGLKKLKIIDDQIAFTGGIPSQGAHTKMVIFIKEKRGNLAAKVFNDQQQYERESNQIKSISDLSDKIKLLNYDKNLEVPRLVRIYDTMAWPNSGVILMEEAPGESLSSLLKKLYSIDNSEIKKYFNSMGLQQGNLQALFYLKNDKKLLYHPDLHDENIFFDKNNLQSYWIDLSGLTESRGTLQPLTGYNSSIKLYAWRSSELDRRYADLIKESTTFNELRKYFTNIEKGLIAFRSWHEGFIKALRDNGLTKEAHAEEAELEKAVKSMIKPIRKAATQKLTTNPISNAQLQELQGLCKVCI